MSELSQPDLQKRFLFIDLFRGAAIFFMLQGHTYRLLLDQSLKQAPLFQFHELLHGITAPAFLFGAGITFVIASRKRWEDYHQFRIPLVKRLGRLLLVIGLGIALHLPYFSLRKIFREGTQEEILQLTQFDILHCIGFGLLFLQGLVFFFKSQRRFYLLVVVASTAIPLLSPLMWSRDFLEHFPPLIAQALNSTHGSPFPIFPFMGFLFVGVVISWEFVLAAEQGRAHVFMRKLLKWGPIFAGLGILFEVLPVQVYPAPDFWYTSPNYFLIRVGVLLLFTSGFWSLASWVERVSAPTAPARVGRVLALFGKESLLIYVLQAIILFGTVINPAMNLENLLGTRLGFWETSVVFLILAGLMFAVAVAWSSLKTSKQVLHRAVLIVLAVSFLLPFLLREH